MKPVITLESMLGIDWERIDSCCSIRALTIDGLKPFVNVEVLTRRYYQMKNGNSGDSSYRNEIPGKLDFFIESVLVPHSRIATSPSIKLIRCYDGRTTEITLSKHALRSIIYDSIMTYFRDIN